MITGWGDVVAMASQNACFPIYVVRASRRGVCLVAADNPFQATTAVNVLTMHMFLLHRYTVLSKNWIVAGILSIVALTAAVGVSL